MTRRGDATPEAHYDVVIPGLNLIEESPGVYYDANKDGRSRSSARYDREGRVLKPWVPPTLSMPQVRPVPEGWEWRVSLRHDFDAEVPEGHYRSELEFYPADWADCGGFAHSRSEAERKARRAAEVGDADWEDV